MALISLSFKKIYKPTNNNLRTSSNTSRANQDNSPRINRGTGYENQRAVNVAGARENVGTSVVQKSGIQCYNCKEYGHLSRECQKPKCAKDAAYHKEKMLLCKQEEAGVQLNAEQADWKDDTDDESDDQELEAHYMYMAQIQEVTPDPVDNSGPIFDAEPLHKVQNNNDNYNVFAIENEHPEQPESVNDIYLEEQGDTNITIDSLDICYDREQDDQDDTDELDQERDLLASLIEKLKCEIDDSKNRNKFLETSNKALVDKLKTNQLMFKDLKKFQAELDKYHDVNYASKVVIDCAKAKMDLMSYKIESEKSSNEYTRKINDLNQMISDMKKELFAHQETISIMSQEKEAQIKFYKTREDKELDKVIALENKVKVLDDIVYKTGQSVQIMNMLNRNCKMSFEKPEFLKKAQRANPRLYDIGCYNDNLALMLAPESDETIRLAKESQSKLSDLIRPFDYDQLNNLYDFFVPQREKSHEQHYFSKDSKMSHTSANNEIFKESFNKQTTLLEKQMDESILWDQKCKSSKELFKVKRSLDTIFDEKFLGTVKFGNDQIAPIIGYGDLVQGTITIKRVYYSEGHNHYLFSIVNFVMRILEVAFSEVYSIYRDLKEIHGYGISSIHLNYTPSTLLSKNNIVNGLPKLKIRQRSESECSSVEMRKQNESGSGKNKRDEENVTVVRIQNLSCVAKGYAKRKDCYFGRVILIPDSDHAGLSRLRKSTFGATISRVKRREPSHTTYGEIRWSIDMYLSKLDTQMIADIEDNIHGPSDAMQTLPQPFGGSLLQPPITKTKSAQIESRARRDHSINLIRTQCQNTLVGHHKVHRFVNKGCLPTHYLEILPEYLVILRIELVITGRSLRFELKPVIKEILRIYLITAAFQRKSDVNKSHALLLKCSKSIIQTSEIVDFNAFPTHQRALNRQIKNHQLGRML
ncbi:integrase, catalytic region, zinc finger, CCHC-type containing protein [Tanacetum coccineum]